MLKTSIRFLRNNSIIHRPSLALSPLMHPILFSSVTDRENDQIPYLIHQAVARTLAQMDIPYLAPQTQDFSCKGFFEKCDLIAKTDPLEPKVYIAQDVLQSILTYLYAKILEQVKGNERSVRLNQLLEEFLEMTERPHFQEILGAAKPLNLLVDYNASDISAEKVIQDLQSFAVSFRMSLTSPTLQNLASLDCKVTPYSSSSGIAFPITPRSGNSFIGDEDGCRRLLSGRISYPGIRSMPTPTIRQLLENPYLSFDSDGDLNCFLHDLENLNKISEEEADEITRGVRSSMRFSCGLHAITEIHRVESPLTSKLKDLSSRARSGIRGEGRLPLLPKFLKYEDIETRDDCFDPGNFRANGYLSSIEEFEALHTEHGILCHGTPDPRNVMAILRNGFVLSGSGQGAAAYGSGAYTTKDIGTAVTYCRDRNEEIPAIVFFEIKKSKKIRILDLQSNKIPKNFIKRLEDEANAKGVDLNELLANKYSIDIIIPDNDRPNVLIQNNAGVVFPKNSEECLAKELRYFEKRLTQLDQAKANGINIFLRFAQHVTQIQPFRSQVENLKKTISNHLKKNPETSLEMVRQDGRFLEYVPKDISNYTGIALAAVKENIEAFKFVPKDISNYSKIVLEAVKQNGMLLEDVPKDISNYTKIALAAVNQDAEALEFVSKDASNYEQIALAAVKRNGMLLEDVPEDISNYNKIALVAVIQTSGAALEFVSKDISNYTEMVLTAVSQNPWVLQFVPKDTSNYTEIALVAVQTDLETLKFVPKDISTYKEIALAAINRTPWALEFSSEETSDYTEIALTAVKQNGIALKFVPKESSNYTEIALAAVKQCGMALQFVPKESSNYTEIAFAAVKQYGGALEFVPKDTPDYSKIALAAI